VLKGPIYARPRRARGPLTAAAVGGYAPDVQTPPAVRIMQIVFGVLAAQFIIPSLSYLFTPVLAVDQAVAIGRLLGGGDYPVEGERGHIFRVLAAGNVFTLGVLCLMMLRDIARYHVLIPVFVVLKGFSALGYLYIYLAELRFPLFLAVFFWDGLAVFLVTFFGRRAHRAVLAQGRPGR
jgi:hypothetical protein